MQKCTIPDQKGWKRWFWAKDGMFWATIVRRFKNTAFHFAIPCPDLANRLALG